MATEKITWRSKPGSLIRPGFYGEFQFRLRNPATPQRVCYSIDQWYNAKAKGGKSELVSWSGRLNERYACVVRRRRRELAVVCAAAVALWAPAAAQAHALVKPSASRPADSQLYTLTVPNERDVPTVEVALKIPAGIDSVVVESTPGWKTQIERTNDRVDVVRFTGSLAPDFFATFRFIARNPVEEGDARLGSDAALRGRRSGRLDRAAGLRHAGAPHERQRVGSGH